MTFTCPHCGQSLELDDQHAGREIQCPACGRYIKSPGQPSGPPTPPPSPATSAPPTYPKQAPVPPQRVHVIDFEMPFGSMVMFMIKWALAAIPAMIILCLVYMLIVGTLIGGCASAFMSMK